MRCGRAKDVLRPRQTRIKPFYYSNASSNITGQLHMGHAFRSDASGCPYEMEEDARVQRSVAPLDLTMQYSYGS